MKFITFLALVAVVLLALTACAPASAPSTAPTTAAQGLATVTTAVGGVPTLGPTETATTAASSTPPALAPTVETTPTTARTAAATSAATLAATRAATTAATPAATTAATSVATAAATAAATSAATAAATSGAGPTPAQSITVVGTEFKFDPNQLSLKVGQRVRIVFQNKGTVDHELEIEDMKADNVVLDESQGGNMPEDEMREAMDDAAKGVVHEHAAGGGTVTVDFTPTTAGTYDIACNLPGHKEAGMVGSIVVQP